MSDSEQDAALLRLVKERSASKKRRSLLLSDLTMAGCYLRTISELLKGLARLDGSDLIRISGEIAKLPEICALPRVGEALAEFIELQATIVDLDARAAELGVD